MGRSQRVEKMRHSSAQCTGLSVSTGRGNRAQGCWKQRGIVTYSCSQSRRDKATRERETAQSSDPSHYLCKGCFVPYHWQATPSKHLMPKWCWGHVGILTRQSESQGLCWRQGSFPSLAGDILIKFSRPAVSS